MLSNLIALIRQGNKDDEVLRGQLSAFTRQIPILYVLLCGNAWALAATHMAIAPDWLTIHLPLLLTTLCMMRLYIWRKTPAEGFSRENAIKRIRSTTILGSILGLAFMLWAIKLSSYSHEIIEPGRLTTTGHVVFFIGITVVSCIFLLMHAMSAALAITVCIVLPFSAYLAYDGTFVERAVALNLIMVAMAMVYILYVSFSSFETMILSQKESRKLSEDNARLANIDSLTGLPNRRIFFQEIERLAAHRPSFARSYAVGVMDLDGFKQVNDIYGHAVGDRLLVMCGDRLSALASDDVFISRLGGDEFGIVIRDQLDQGNIIAIGNRICDAVRVPFHLPSATVSVGASLGFSILTTRAMGPETFYEQADYALYHAKQHQRGAVVVFSEAHQSEIKAAATIEQALRHADLEQELSLRFQPIFNAQDNSLTAFEALARWDNPVLGSVSPAVFIPVAERTEHIHTITRILLGKLLHALKSWPSSIHASFNLSIRDVMSHEQMLHIVMQVRASGIDPQRLTFEVTETSLMDEFERAHESIAALKALGCQIALDDFGTGYSSLSYIHKLPLDKLKIDRSFVRDIETNAMSRDIVRSIVGLCDVLKLACVVEGMETEEQMMMLKSLGCALMQGYYFGKPMLFEETQSLAARAA